MCLASLMLVQVSSAKSQSRNQPAPTPASIQHLKTTLTGLKASLAEASKNLARIDPSKAQLAKDLGTAASALSNSLRVLEVAQAANDKGAVEATAVGLRTTLGYLLSSLGATVGAPGGAAGAGAGAMIVNDVGLKLYDAGVDVVGIAGKKSGERLVDFLEKSDRGRALNRWLAGAHQKGLIATAREAREHLTSKAEQLGRAVGARTVQLGASMGRMIMDRMIGPLAERTRQLPTSVSGLTRQAVRASGSGAPGGGSPTQASPTQQASQALGTVTNNSASQIQEVSFTETASGTVNIPTGGLTAAFNGSGTASRSGFAANNNLNFTIDGVYQGNGPGQEADAGSAAFTASITGRARVINNQIIDPNARLTVTSPEINAVGIGSGNFKIDGGTSRSTGTFSGTAISEDGAAVGSATINYKSAPAGVNP